MKRSLRIVRGQPIEIAPTSHLSSTLPSLQPPRCRCLQIPWAPWSLLYTSFWHPKSCAKFLCTLAHTITTTEGGADIVTVNRAIFKTVLSVSLKGNRYKKYHWSMQSYMFSSLIHINEISILTSFLYAGIILLIGARGRPCISPFALPLKPRHLLGWVKLTFELKRYYINCANSVIWIRRSEAKTREHACDLLSSFPNVSHCQGPTSAHF